MLSATIYYSGEINKLTISSNSTILDLKRKISEIMIPVDSQELFVLNKGQSIEVKMPQKNIITLLSSQLEMSFQLKNKKNLEFFGFQYNFRL